MLIYIKAIGAFIMSNFSIYVSHHYWEAILMLMLPAYAIVTTAIVLEFKKR